MIKESYYYYYYYYYYYKAYKGRVCNCMGAAMCTCTSVSQWLYAETHA